MQILTVVLEGALAHEGSSGSKAILRAGDVQRMSAGRGVAHSERNASNEEAFQLLQIWILQSEHGVEPSHAEARDLFPVSEEGHVGLRKLVAPMGSGGGDRTFKLVSGTCRPKVQMSGLLQSRNVRIPTFQSVHGRAGGSAPRCSSP